MARMSFPPLPEGFSQTCWEALRMAHPADWEPARLSAPREPAQCILVDRQYQRLQVRWERLGGQPDLEEMYRRLRVRHKGPPAPEPLKGVPEWVGMVRREGDGCVVHAGRFFPARRWLVQVVLVWPGRRDRQVERAVLEGIVPQDSAGGLWWEALGLAAWVPEGYQMAEATSKVGRVCWRFRRRGERGEGLVIERLALPVYFLDRPVGLWLAEEIPRAFRRHCERAVDCGGQGGWEVFSRRAYLLEVAVGVAASRLDRAWLCRSEQRVYRVAYWRRARRGAVISWPEGLEVGCCGGVRFAGPARAARRG